MGGIVSALGSAIGGSGLSNLVLGVLDRIKLSPEKKAEIQAQMEAQSFELAKMEAELKKIEEENRAKEIEIAGANIRAETQSEDNFTKRMRPMFGYIVEFILLWNYVVVPLFHHEPVLLPEAIFWLFGSVMLGYVGARTWEKIALPSGGKK